MHEHIRLERGRAANAQVYPDELCRAICRGIGKQIEADRAGQFLLFNIHNDKLTIVEGLKQEELDIRKKCTTIEEDNTEELEIAWDDVFGVALDPKKVKQARME